MTEPATHHTLPPWVRRAVLALMAGLAGLWILRDVVSSLRPLLLVLLVSFFVSFALEPAVNRLERTGLRRGPGTALVMLAVVGALGGFGVQVGSLLAEQVTDFSENVPRYLEDIDGWLEDSFGIQNATADLRADYDTGALAQRLGDVADDLARFGTTVANVLFQLFTVSTGAPRCSRAVCAGPSEGGLHRCELRRPRRLPRGEPWDQRVPAPRVPGLVGGRTGRPVPWARLRAVR